MAGLPLKETWSPVAHLKGDIAEARQVMAELVSRRQEFTLGFTREHYPQTNPEYMDHFIDGLLKAGVPE